MNVSSGSLYLPGKLAEREKSTVLTFKEIVLLAGYTAENWLDDSAVDTVSVGTKVQRNIMLILKEYCNILCCVLTLSPICLTTSVPYKLKTLCE